MHAQTPVPRVAQHTQPLLMLLLNHLRVVLQGSGAQRDRQTAWGIFSELVLGAYFRHSEISLRFMTVAQQCWIENENTHLQAQGEGGQWEAQGDQGEGSMSERDSCHQHPMDSLHLAASSPPA